MTATAPQPRYGERIRSVRVEDALWDAAKERAAAEGKTVAEILRAALRRYVTKAAK